MAKEFGRTVSQRNKLQGHARNGAVFNSIDVTHANNFDMEQSGFFNKSNLSSIQAFNSNFAPV